jgi:hypothetical protein
MRVRAILIVASYGVVGFVVQILILWWILEHGLPEPYAKSLALLLSPGIALFWAQGIHSDSGLPGFGLGMALNTAYYGGMLFGLTKLWRTIRRSRKRPS